MVPTRCCDPVRKRRSSGDGIGDRHRFIVVSIALSVEDGCAISGEDGRYLGLSLGRSMKLENAALDFSRLLVFNFLRGFSLLYAVFS